MDFLKAMTNRYTTKLYDNNQKVETQIIEELKQILRLSPSSINSQPWLFDFVTDQSTKEHLAEVSAHNSAKLIDCQLVVVFSRIDSISDFEQWMSGNLAEPAINYYNANIKPLSESEIKCWFSKQVYLSIGVLLSACATMGLDSTPMEGIDCKKYDEILEHSTHKTLAAVAIGIRNSDDFNQPSRMPKSRREISQIIRSI